MQETWKDIEGYEGVYMICTDGRIKSSERVWVCTNSFVVKPEKILNGYVDHYGYKTIRLSKNNIQKRFKIHRLVAAAFIPNPEKKPTVNHKNGVKVDNSLDNLEWCTDAENLKHARQTGLMNDYGENSVRSKLKTDQVINIISLYRSGKYSQKELAEKYGVHVMTINLIVGGKKWKHITNGKLIEVSGRTRRVLLLNTLTGVFYESIKEAARSGNYNYSNLVSAISGAIKNKTPFIKV